MAAPNLAEKKLIEILRQHLSDLDLYDDSEMFLVRWIRARNHHLRDAEVMLRKHVQWYKENNVATASSFEMSPEFKRTFPTYTLGRDRENSTVVVLPFGKWPLRKIPKCRNEFLSYVAVFNEQSLSLMKGKFTSDGIPATQHVHIYDFEGFSFGQLSSVSALQTFVESCKIAEANYPETMKITFIINASRIFATAFNVIKPVLSQNTLDKIAIFDCDSTKWMPVLQKAIPLEILPIKYGGVNPVELI